MRTTALYAQDCSRMHFCDFDTSRSFQHTRSGQVLCEPLHCKPRCALECILAISTSVDHSSTLGLVKWYANHCIVSLMHSIVGASLSYFVLYTAHLQCYFLQCNCLQCSLARAYSIHTQALVTGRVVVAFRRFSRHSRASVSLSTQQASFYL